MPGHPTPAAASPTAARQWVDMRVPRSGALGLFAVLVLLCVTYAVFVTAIALRDPTAGQFDDVDPLVALVFLWGLSVAGVVALVRVAPRRLTRQGLSVDHAGIALVQGPLLWFRGRTTHIPWSEVHTVMDTQRVKPGRRGTSRLVRSVNIMLHYPDRLYTVPTWAMLSSREDSLPPASRLTPKTRVSISSQQHQAAVALHAARPNLYRRDT